MNAPDGTKIAERWNGLYLWAVRNPNHGSDQRNLIEEVSRAEAALASAERRHEEEIANQYKLIEAEREDRKVATARINKLEGALRTIADHGRQLPWAECARLANAALGQP